MKSLKKKFIAGFVIIVMVWLISPIPELSIIYMLVFGGTMHYFFGDWIITVMCTIITCLLGLLLVKKLKMKQKIEKLLESLEEQKT